MPIIRIVVVVAATLLFAFPGSAAALDLEPRAFPDIVVGLAYEFDLDAEEGCMMSYQLKHINGNMPPGIAIHHEGQPVRVSLRGTPTTPGRYEFFLNLSDDCNSVNSQASYTMIVLPALEIQQPSLPAAKIGAFYSTTLTALGGGSQFWSVVEGALPTGLTLAEKTGVLSGVPTALGTSTFKIQVRDPDPRRTVKQFALSVVGDVTAAPFTPTRGEVGVAYSAAPQASGGLEPRTWAAVGSLPAGLVLNAATGALTGRPTAAGSFTVGLQVTDALGSKATVNSSVSILPRLRITTRSVDGATAGQAYTERLRVGGGTTTRRWSIASGKLPSGIRLNRTTGVLSGTARRAGTYRVTVKVTDGLGGSATTRIVLTVA